MPPQSNKPKSQPKQTTVQMIEIAQNKEVLRIDIRDIGNQKTSPNKRPSTSTTVKQVQLQRDLREKADSGRLVPKKR